jgi:hypothetical protein
MAVKRRVGKARAHPITPEAVEAYRAGDRGALHRVLGLKPWEASPFFPDGPDDVSPWPEGSGGARSWPQALELKEQLEVLARDIPEDAA